MILSDNRKGSITLFLTITTSAALILFTVLFEIAETKFDKYVLMSAMDRECEVVLSGYNERIYDRFGLFAYEHSRSNNEKNITVCDSCSNIYNLKVFPGASLRNETLFDQITRFSLVRFPVDVSKKFLGWLNDVCINDKVMNALSIETGNDESLNSICDRSTLTEIISEVLKNEKVRTYLKEKLEGIFSIDELSDMIHEYSVSMEQNILPISSSDDMFITNDLLGYLTELLSNFYSSDTGQLYKRLSFEYYLGEMFSCRVNSFVNEKNEVVSFKNLRGVEFERYGISDAFEMERLIFGFENNDRNADMAQLIIVGVRFAVNMLSNILDPSNNQEVKTASAALSAAIALASAGSIAVPPEAIEYALHVILASCQSVQDWGNMMDSEKIALIPLEGYDSIKLSYRDHLRLMLLCLPLQLKLDRISSILDIYRDNHESGYYSNVKVSCLYKGRLLEIEKNYFR